MNLHSGFSNAREWLRGLIRATIRPRPRIRIWKWLDANVRVPEESGSPFPGQLKTSRFPIYRGLYNLAQKRGVHFITLCASARVGKTLFSICIALYWIAERIGHVAWLDPSGISAKKFVRNELEHFLRQCDPVWKLAIVSKSSWQTLWKTFRGKIMRIIASGAEADLHGFNAELGIVNERDRCRGASDKDASSPEKLIARTRLYPHSRLIVDNSTPGTRGEFSPIWQNFLKGSQHYCYLPCPHCTEAASAPEVPFVPADDEKIDEPRSALSYDPRLRGWQRLTFSTELKLVPFDENLEPLLNKKGKPLARDKWREEKTGQIHFEKFARWIKRPAKHDATKMESVKVGYDIDAVERGAAYQCACCGKDIDFINVPPCIYYISSFYSVILYSSWFQAERSNACVLA